MIETSSTTSSSSRESHKSDSSLVSQITVLGGDIKGLPDVFVLPNAIIRPNLLRKGQNCDEISIHFDGTDYICRICHGGNSSGDLLTPCRCRGTIALAHLKCLEIWLNESNRNDCELCQYHYTIIREPKYSILWSILVFLRHPEEHLQELLIDIFTLVVYTPSTVTSTYMLLLLCESLSKAPAEFRRSFISHGMAFTAISGIAAINFIYTSWLVLTVEKYVDYWRDWYKKNCKLRVILSQNKLSQNATISNLPR